jgi:tyrosyl-tRNA synthetase
MLASEVVKLVHSEAGLLSALNATKIFFGEKIENLKDKDLMAIFKDVASVEINRTDLVKGILVIDLLAQTPLFSSKGDAKRSIEQKGVYRNNNPILDMTTPLGESPLASETFMVIRKGKKNYCVVKFI